MQVSALHMYLVPTEVREGVDSLELKLWVVVSHHRVLETEPELSAKATSILLSHLSSPCIWNSC